MNLNLTIDEIVEVTTSLGAQDYKKTENGEYIFRTICHNGENNGSHKLYLYPDTKLFHCYTHCAESFDIYDLVKKVKHYDSFYECVTYVSNILGISFDNPKGFTTSGISTDDWKIFEKYNRNREKIEFEYKAYKNTLLDLYYEICPIEWTFEGISEEVLREYNIRYDLDNNKIIIPHYDTKNNLIGIRGRSLNSYEIDEGYKYTPVKVQNKFYKHPLQYNLYGLNHTINAVKSIKKIMLFESEKSVLKCDTYFGKDNFTVAVCGSNISDYQRDIIINLGVKEVFIAFDKEYENIDTEEYALYESKVLKLANKFTPYVVTWILWDVKNLLEYKDAPCDKGKEVLLKLMENKLEVES